MALSHTEVLDYASPFHFRCDQEWKVIGVGPSLAEHLPRDPIGLPLDELFTILRPKTTSARDLDDLSGQLILLRTKTRNLDLRGQWQELAGLGRVVLCSPWFTSDDQWRKTGLKMRQLGPHDASGDYFVLLTAARQQAEDLQRLVQEATARESRLAAIVQHMEEGLLLIDENGTVQSANPASCEFLNRARQEVEGRQIAELMTPTGGAHDEALSREWSIAGKDGPGVQVRGSQYPIQTASGPLEVILFRDVSEEEHLLQMQRNFVAMVSHELRTPLSAIKAPLAMTTSGRLGEINSDIQEVLEIASRNAERLHHLVDDVIDLEKLQSGNLPMIPSQFSSSELVDRIQDELKAVASQAGVLLDIEEDPFTLYGDRGRILQVLTNLVANAIRHSPKRGVVRVKLKQTGDLAHLMISDQGPGIPHHLREHIFDRFFQIKSQTNNPSGGTGLGLAISKLIVNQHRGRIWAEAGPDGRGSLFQVELPLTPKPSP